MPPHRGGMMRPPGFQPRKFIPHIPFDFVMGENSFPKVKAAPEDNDLTQALLKRNQDLTPSPQEQAAVLNLVTKIQSVMDNLIVAPGTFDSCQVDEVRQVGSFKKGTMVSGRNVADIVVIIKTLPTAEAVSGLATKVVEDLRKQTPPEIVNLNVTEEGFQLANRGAAVRILITTIHQNYRKLDPEIHLDLKVMQRHMAAIRHSRWFEENAHHSSIKVLIRILRDMKNRFEGLEALNPWILDLLGHYSIMNNPTRQALPINVAFRRCLQLLSAGLFLPGSTGVVDPCEGGTVRVHTAMTLEQQDVVCLTAQTLLRVLTHGGYKQVLGLERGGAHLTTDMSVWDGIVVSPLDKAYEKPADTEDKDTEDMEAEDSTEAQDSA